MLQEKQAMGLMKLLPLGTITITNYKGMWVYVSDIDKLKQIYEKLNEGFILEYTSGPALYFYHLSAKKIEGYAKNKHLNIK